MTNALESILTNISVSEFGIVVPKYLPSRESAFEYYYEELSDNDSDEASGDNLKVSDPYEAKYVEVKPSLIEGAGEGLFARADRRKALHRKM